MKKRYEEIPSTIDEYISLQPVFLQNVLKDIRNTIIEAAPGATEKISYGMPAFSLNGILVYFGVFKNHIGFFPTASGIEAFRDELSQYRTSKGTVQFPFNKPVPLDIISEIVKFRIEVNRGKGKRG